jgi:hypothetical protein
VYVPSVPLPPEPGGWHTRLWVRGWGSPNSDDLRRSLALCLLLRVAQPYTTWPRWREQGGGCVSLSLVLLCTFFPDGGFTAWSQIKNSPTFQCSETGFSFEGNSLFCLNSVDILYLFQSSLYRCIVKNICDSKKKQMYLQADGRQVIVECVGNSGTEPPPYVLCSEYPPPNHHNSFLYKASMHSRDRH